MNFEEIYSWVKDLPIIDWHNHLDVGAIAADKPFGSLYEIWVKTDPYKHRAMRICGVPERLITGDADETGTGARSGTGTGTTGVSPVDVPGAPTGTTGVSPVGEDEKWCAWMRTLPQLVGNPIFTWARMELEALGLNPEPYLHGKGENVSLAAWTPSRLLAHFNVEWMSPCADSAQMERLATGRMPVVPVVVAAGLGQRASRPLTWSSPLLHIFTSPGQDVAAHFSHTLSTGESHRRNLPHVAQSSTLVFVTFRLGDSLPAAQLAELEEMRRALNGRPASSDELRAQYAKIDAWLDAGHGSCVLADAKCRKIVEDALRFFDAGSVNGQDARCPSGDAGIVNGQDARCPSGDAGIVNGQDARCPSGDAGSVNGQDARCLSERDGEGTGTTGARPRYRLHAYIVMPNHVHVLFELFDAKALSRILHSWKSYTAKAINREMGTTGAVWHAEYYDRLIRDGEHYLNVIRYLRKNEAAAGAIARKKSGGVANGQGARCPSGGVCVVPSLRMNAGERISQSVLERFDAAGCRVIDISIDDEELLDREFDSLSAVAAFAKAHGWTMLLHMGALRSTSDRLRQAAGPAGGYAGMRKPLDPAKIAKFLNRLERNGQDARCPSGRCGRTGTTGVSPVDGCLPRTILMTLNPEAHAQLAVLAGSFVEDGVPGKVQLGPAWWWCDHRDGIFDVFEKSAAYGVLSTFVGMTTDSRSFLSFVRHDYFRRLLARWVAGKVADGDFPDDETLLRPICENICYGNARDMVFDNKSNNQTIKQSKQSNNSYELL